MNRRHLKIIAPLLAVTLTAGMVTGCGAKPEEDKREITLMIPDWGVPDEELLEKINEIGLGPAGLGGDTTALAVNINTYATHIAGLPVAVNICCHVNRHIVRTI